MKKLSALTENRSRLIIPYHLVSNQDLTLIYSDYIDRKDVNFINHSIAQ